MRIYAAPPYRSQVAFSGFIPPLPPDPRDYQMTLMELATLRANTRPGKNVSPDDVKHAVRLFVKPRASELRKGHALKNAIAKQNPNAAILMGYDLLAKQAELNATQRHLKAAARPLLDDLGEPIQSKRKKS